MVDNIGYSEIDIDYIKNSDEIKNLLMLTQRQMEIQGYTEHSYRHVSLVSSKAGEILTMLKSSDREIELGKIAGYLHDIGNAINREDHAHSGAILAYNILIRSGMHYKEASEIMFAIGNHDEATGTAVSRISAALILADKSDVHRSRVTNRDLSTFDIHDRVNYAVVKSDISVSENDKIAFLDLIIDTSICPVMDYFEIFLGRMTMNRRAAAYLGLDFALIINGTRLL